MQMRKCLEMNLVYVDHYFIFFVLSILIELEKRHLISFICNEISEEKK